jgi:tRNA(fMet)-specific endonuclease VapC
LIPIRYMLDTNMVSYIARGRSKEARRRLAQLQEDEVACISTITEAEIRYGLAKRPEATALAATMEDVMSRLHILSWDREAAQAHGRLRARLEASGQTMGSMDMLIFAHAAAAGAVLVTNDKGFAVAAGSGPVDAPHAWVDWATDV